MPTVENQPDEAGAKPLLGEDTPKSHRAFARVTRELSDDELNSPGARKLLLERLAQADDDIAALKSFQAKFHEADKSNGVLEEKLKISKANEAISMGCLVAGAAALGYVPSLWSSTTTPTYAGPIVLGFAVVVVGVGIWAKVIRR